VLPVPHFIAFLTILERLGDRATNKTKPLGFHWIIFFDDENTEWTSIYKDYCTTNYIHGVRY